MLTCMDGQIDASKMDRETFKFHHKLMDHPALQLDTLVRVIPELPADHVKYSKGLMKNGDDCENAYREQRNGLSLVETIENIRTSDSYIMVRSPQVHEAFHGVFRDLSGDVEQLLKQQFGHQEKLLLSPQLYMFIASPNGHTPFHIDRNSTMLLQFRGSKEMVIFPQWSEDVVTAERREAYAAYDSTKLPWSEEMDRLAQRFDFQPGDGLHIPFMAGHYVRNGPSDVSISMSIIFNTPESNAQLNALRFNHRVRGWMKPIGLQPTPVGRESGRDVLKSNLWRAHLKVQRMLGLEREV